MLSEAGHFLLSLLAGFLVYKIYKRREAFLFALISGFFIDIDHLFDYFVYYKKGFAFSAQEFFSSMHFKAVGKIHVYLHSYELLIVLLAIYFLIIKFTSRRLKTFFSAAFLALVLGMTFHLCFDIYHNNVDPLAYSLIYRVENHFNIIMFK